MMGKMADATNLAHRVVGDGPPIVLMHGFPLSRHMWLPQIEYLQKKFRVVALDLLGHGDSKAPETPYSMDLFAEDIVDLIKTLNFSPAIFVGHSMGGYVLFRIYEKYPDVVKALVFMNTRAEPDSPEAKAKRFDTINRIKREGPTPFLTDFAKLLLSESTVKEHPELTEQLLSIMLKTPQHTLTNTLAAMAERPDSVPLLSRIVVPTLIITGAEDKIIPLEAAKTLNNGIRGSRLAVISQTGHMPNIERPDTFNEELTKFL
ncbi:MAG: alpha/beta hydrolase [Thaumarchaeota archaeon]|nr:alpha/beta hydrolase [Nitrososphaerota archaeon]